MSKTKSPCELTGCEVVSYGRGLCRPHWRVWRKENPTTPRHLSAAERLWVKVDKSGACWKWTGTHARATGHGNFKVNGKVTLVHRFSYELANGPIPEGLVIDHICRNASCVNPKHLRAVTQKQNMENRGGAHSNSKSGVRGVWLTPSGKWAGGVKHLGVTYSLGTFSTLEEANNAAIARRNELFTCNDADRQQ